MRNPNRNTTEATIMCGLGFVPEVSPGEVIPVQEGFQELYEALLSKRWHDEIDNVEGMARDAGSQAVTRHVLMLRDALNVAGRTNDDSGDAGMSEETWRELAVGEVVRHVGTEAFLAGIAYERFRREQETEGER